MDMTVRVASAGDDARGCGKGKDFEDGKDGEKAADNGIKQDEAQPHEEWLDVVHDEVTLSRRGCSHVVSGTGGFCFFFFSSYVVAAISCAAWDFK